MYAQDAITDEQSAICQYCKSALCNGCGDMYKTEVQVAGDSKWYSNAVRHASPEAEVEYAEDLFARWTQTVNWRVVRVASGEVVRVAPWMEAE